MFEFDWLNKETPKYVHLRRILRMKASKAQDAVRVKKIGEEKKKNSSSYDYFFEGEEFESELEREKKKRLANFLEKSEENYYKDLYDKLEEKEEEEEEEGEEEKKGENVDLWLENLLHYSTFIISKKDFDKDLLEGPKEVKYQLVKNELGDLTVHFALSLPAINKNTTKTEQSYFNTFVAAIMIKNHLRGQLIQSYHKQRKAEKGFEFQNFDFLIRRYKALKEFLSINERGQSDAMPEELQALIFITLEVKYRLLLDEIRKFAYFLQEEKDEELSITMNVIKEALCKEASLFFFVYLFESKKELVLIKREILDFSLKTTSIEQFKKVEAQKELVNQEWTHLFNQKTMTYINAVTKNRYPFFVK